MTTSTSSTSSTLAIPDTIPEAAPVQRRVARTAPARTGSATSLLRLLILLLGAAALLSTTYAALTHWRSEDGNAASPLFVPGTTIGQSFVARYPDLSGVELRLSKEHLGGNRPGASLVLRLRSAPGPGPDLAAVTLHFTDDIEESAYHLFAFPPIPDSEGKSYYIEAESPDGSPDNALTLLWWQQFSPTLLTDPYAGGQAYLDGVPQQGDLAFGLQYQPSPISALHILARSATSNLPPPLMLLFLLMGMLLAGVTAYLSLARKARPRDLKAALLRFSLPLILAVALLNGLLYALLVPPWQGPDEHGHFIYAALLDRHNLDDGAVQRLHWGAPGPDQREVLALKAAIVASMGQNDWTRLVRGHPTPGAPSFAPGVADLRDQFLWELRQPPAYYWLCAAGLHVARFFGVGSDPFTDPQGALRIMRLVSVAENMGVVALAWAAGTLLGGRRSWLRLLLPLTVALLPMHSFIASVTSNDIASELAVSALFVSLIALLKWPSGRRGAALLLLSAVCFLACAEAKLTAVVSGGMLLLFCLFVWLGLLLTRLFERRRSRAGRQIEPGRGRPPLRQAIFVPALITALFLVLCLVGALLTFRQDNLAAAWQAGAGPSARTPHVATSAAHDGSYVLQVPGKGVAYQWVALPWPHEALSVTLSLWARPIQTATLPSTLGKVQLQTDQRGTLSRIGAETLSATSIDAPLVPALSATPGDWQRFIITTTATRADRKVWVRLLAGDTTLQFDDLQLSATQGAAAEQPSATSKGLPAHFPLPLYNGSAEQGSLSLSPFALRLLKGENPDIVDVLVNPQAFSKREIWGRYAVRQFQSFWGNFGWLSIPLQDQLYTAIGVAILLALAGLAAHSLLRVGRAWGAWAVMSDDGRKRKLHTIEDDTVGRAWGAWAVGRWTYTEWLGLVTLLALGAAIMITFARQMAPLSTSGVHTDPQGRYLFGFTTPIVWLLLAGLSFVWSSVAHSVHRRLTRSPIALTGLLARANRRTWSADVGRDSMPWSVWLWCSSVSFFAAYCLLSLIAPYYYKG